MGGLRPYTTEVATPAFRETIAAHWQQVARESGLPFNDAALAREGFVYDTEPACRAVVAVRATARSRARFPTSSACSTRSTPKGAT